MKLKGVIPPLMTLYDQYGEVDVPATRRLVSFLAKYVHALFVCGTYGGGPLMSMEERKTVFAAVSVEVNRLGSSEQKNSVPIIAHVGATNSKTAVELAEHAEDFGAMAVAAVPPYYLKHDDDNILRYFDDLLNAVSIPVYVYNNPKTVGYPVTAQLLSKLEKIGVSGIKDSSFDILNIDEYRLSTSDNFDIVLGTESMFLSAYMLGVRAFVPGLGNAFPEVTRELFDACEAGEFERATNVHRQIYRLRKAAHALGHSSLGVLEMLHARGFDAGDPRPPFARVDRRTAEELRVLLVDILGDDYAHSIE